MIHRDDSGNVIDSPTKSKHAKRIRLSPKATEALRKLKLKIPGFSLNQAMEIYLNHLLKKQLP